MIILIGFDLVNFLANEFVNFEQVSIKKCPNVQRTTIVHVESI